MTAIAIDGPAGAGKSFVARSVAAALGLRYIDTGAMYRAVALAAIEEGVDPDDAEQLADLLSRSRVGFAETGVTLNGVPVEERVRERDVTDAAARVARHQVVRDALVAVQRAAAAEGDVVMEGRDIGTAVLPAAEVKVFLTASLDERVRRRARQLGLPQDAATVSRLQDDIRKRDEADRGRAISPLVQADDAVPIDTTAMSPDQVVERICEIAQGVVMRGEGGN